MVWLLAALLEDLEDLHRTQDLMHANVLKGIYEHLLCLITHIKVVSLLQYFEILKLYSAQLGGVEDAMKAPLLLSLLTDGVS